MCGRVLPPRARSTCTAEAHQVGSRSRSPSGGGAEPLPVTEFLLPVYQNTQKVRFYVQKTPKVFSYFGKCGFSYMLVLERPQVQKMKVTWQRGA